MINLGIIGTGIIWNYGHKQILQKYKDVFNICAFCASSEKSKPKIESEYPTAKFYTDFNKILKNNDIDAVLILTPIPLNGPITKEAIKCKKDVFVEKPICTSGKELKEIMKLNKNESNIYILEEYVYLEKYKIIKNLITSGKIGKLIYYSYTSHYCLEKSLKTNDCGNTQWRIKGNFPLGTLMDGGIHDLAALREIFGTPTSVLAVGTVVRPEFGEFDHILMTFKYASNLVGTYSHAGNLIANQNNFHIHGTEGALHVAKNFAQLNYKNGNEEKIFFPKEDAFDNMWSAIVANIKNGSPIYYSVENGLQDIKTLDSVYHSLKKNEQVKIEDLDKNI